MSGLDHTLEPSRPVRRLEVISGIGGRRRWSVDDKARIVEETLVPGAVVSEIARRHGLTPQQVFGWRRARPATGDGDGEAGSPRFVPAVVEHPKPEPVRKQRKPRRASRSGDATGIIEMEIGGVTVRVGRGAEAKTVAAVIRALKAGAVIGPTGAVRVMVATRPVDFRKGAEGLAALVREEMRADPFSGAVYVFRAKRADRVKLIFWDGTGVCLFAKRLEDGRFRWPSDAGRRDPADGRAALGAVGRARLAAGPRGARDAGAGCGRADLRHSESAAIVSVAGTLASMIYSGHVESGGLASRRSRHAEGDAGCRAS